MLNHLLHKKHIVWDWNGTLLDDLEICLEAIAHVLERFELPRISVEDYRAKFRFPVAHYYADIGLPSSGEGFHAAGDAFIAEYKRLQPRAKLAYGMKDVLQSLHDRGHKQSVLSAAKLSDLKHQLDFYEITHFFEHINGIDDHYAHGKVELGKKFLRESGLDPREAILVGDTDHDAEVAAALGMDILLVGDGHMHHERLSKHGKVVFR